MRWVIALVFLLVSACGSTSDRGDAGDAGDGADAGGDLGGDDGLGGWTFTFPAGLEYCGWNAMVGQAPPYAPFDHKVRLGVREAAVRWPEKQESLQVDLLDRVEVGPDGAIAAATGPGMACLTPYGLGDPDRGEFTRGADQRVVTSYFHLGLDCMHHGGPERFIMIFDAPLDGLHGVTLAPMMMGGMQYELTYLDEDLASAGTEEVTDLQWADPGRQP